LFTGIIQHQGRVAEIRDSEVDRELVIEQAETANQLTLGASVAIDGACQTVTMIDADRFTVQAMIETLRVTTLGHLDVGDAVNLETPVGAGQPMGGHFVQGHVDGMATLASREPVGDAERFEFQAASALTRDLVPKGSIALDGISLTVGPELNHDRFEIYLIPHTLEVTTWGKKAPGSKVNVETDILAKYVRKCLAAQLPLATIEPGA